MRIQGEIAYIVTTAELHREEHFNGYFLIKNVFFGKICYAETSLPEDTDDAVFAGL